MLTAARNGGAELDVPMAPQEADEEAAAPRSGSLRSGSLRSPSGTIQTTRISLPQTPPPQPLPPIPASLPRPPQSKPRGTRASSVLLHYHENDILDSRYPKP